MSSTDIVIRLRGHIAITTRIAFAKDGFPEPVYVHGPSPICQEAADEIESLRAERDEDAADEIELLRSTVTDCRIEIARLTAERDEARRDWCRLWAHGGTRRQLSPTQAARLREWDCFNKEAKP